MFKFNEEKDIDELEEYIKKNNNDMPAAYYINTDVIDNFLKDEIVFTPFVGRVKYEKNSDKRKEYFFDKIDATEYRNKIKEKILKVKDNIKDINVFKNKFKEFKKSYSSVIPSELINKAMLIKDNNPEYTKDIGKFLFENGIILFVEELPDKDWKRLDGFSCFFNDYPVIVIYKKEDKRRMLFTIMHEVYHLIYNENEDNADKFAGCSLLTIKDLKKEYGEDYIHTMKEDENNENYKNIAKNLCNKYDISVEAAINTLKNYNILKKDIDKYKPYFREIREGVEDNSSKIQIKPIYDFID